MVRIRSTASIAFLCLAAWAPGQGLRAPSPHAAIYSPLEDEVPPTNPVGLKNVPMLAVRSTVLHDSEIVDFEQRQVVFKKVDNLGIVVWSYRYGELDEYIENRRRYALARNWHDQFSQPRMTRQEQRNRNFSLDFALPVHYPAWAQRILGKEPPRLSIHGSEEIIVSYDYSSTLYDQAQNVKPNGGLNFENNYSLTVNGSVGRLINVNMSSSNQDEFSFQNPLKDIKLEYKGEGSELEDEVIQEVTAGYTNFDITRTQLSGYSERKEGLFGISMKSKIGPLMLTTVVSHEQGEALEKTFSTTSSNEDMKPLNEKDFTPAKEYRYYFLDTLYRRLYNVKHNTANKKAPDPPAPVVADDIQVWKMVDRAEYKNNANADLNLYRFAADYQGGQSPFRKITGGWYVDKNEGWIRFDTLVVNYNDVIGVYFKALNPDRTPAILKSDTTLLKDSALKDSLFEGQKIMQSLWILKDRDERTNTTSESFGLMWRNVYEMPKFTGDFQIAVYRVQTGATNEKVDQISGRRISWLLGLTDDKGTPYKDSYIFDLTAGTLIIPPYNDSANGNEPFRNPALGADNQADYLYNSKKTDDVFKNAQPKYLMELSGKFTQRKTTFDLGWGVIPGSVRVWGDGTVLAENTDYRVSYDAGTLELISPSAQGHNAIKVQYQSESIFMPEKTVFMGARGEVNLPGIGKNAFIGSSVLFQSRSSRDDNPRIGQEPFNKLLLDVNTAMDFEPEWMTTAVNWLPFISTEAKSTAKLDLELAHSRMYATIKGDAIIDDFESSKNTYPIGMHHDVWHMASPPVPAESLLFRPPAWRSYWFKPDDGDSKHAIKTWSIIQVPESQRKAQQAGQTNLFEPILYLSATPAGPRLRDRYDNPWAGIMTSFPQGSSDRTRDRYFEFIINPAMKHPAAMRGRLYVDFGMISEDLCQNGGPPNMRLDEEDSLGAIVGAGTDCGLDHECDDANEFYLVPNTAHSGWETFGVNSIQLFNPADPAGDNYHRYYSTYDRSDEASSLGNFPYVNGTQGDRPRPTSEDLNNDGLSTGNDYFRYSIDLANLDTSRYVDLQALTHRADSGWYQVRLPIGAESSPPDTVGKPSWTTISFVRIWWSEFDTGSTDTLDRSLIFARMQFVGNQWESFVKPDTTYDIVPDTSPLSPFRIAATRISYNIKIEPSVINTEDDDAYLKDLLTSDYIVRTTDQTNLLRREQSLKLSFKDINPNEGALVRRVFVDHAYDLSSYERMTLFVHGDKDYSGDSLYFVFRFGADENTYYEYRTLLRKGWNINGGDSANWGEPIAIDFKQLMAKKQEMITAGYDTINVQWSIYNDGRPPYYAIRSRSAVPPTISAIKTFIMGVVRGTSSNLSALSGEIWVDDIRASGLRELSGYAAIASLTTQWADFMTLNGSTDYRGGDFREMTQNDLAAGRSSVRGSSSMHLTLDKFFPQNWRLSLPFDASVSGSVERPQLQPNTDISLRKSNGAGDGFTELVSNAATPASHWERRVSSRTFSTSFRKSQGSTNPAIKLTAERLSLNNLSYSDNVSVDHQGEKRDSLGGGDYLNTRDQQDYNGGLAYDLSPREPPKWTKWRPFGNIKLAWFPQDVKNYELTFLPSNLSLDLATLHYGNLYENNEKMLLLGRTTRSFDVSHGLQFKYAPIAPLLDMDYSLSLQRVLSGDLDTIQSQQGWLAFARQSIASPDPVWGGYSYLRGEQGRNQRAGLKFDPRLVDWFDPNVNYTSTFQSQPDRSSKNFDVANDFTFSTTFSLKNLFSSVGATFDSVKAVAGPARFVKDCLDRIELEDINFNYSANASLRNSQMQHDFMTGNISPFDFFRYQLGVPSGRGLADIITGDLDSNAFGGMQYRRQNHDAYDNYKNDSRDVRRSWTLSSRFKMPDPVDLRINNVSLDRNVNYRLTPDTTTRDTTYVFPKVSAGASSGILNKIPAVSKNLKNISLTSSYSYSQEENRKHSYFDTAHTVLATRRIQHQFAPLINFTGQMEKWPINLTYSHNWSINSDKSGEANKKTKGTKHEDDGEIRYSVEKTAERKEIKVLAWAIPLRGRMDLSLRLKRSHDLQTALDNASGTSSGGTEGQPEEKPTTDITEYSAASQLSYDFTDKVNGGASYTFSNHNEVAPQKRTSSQHVFSLNVKISF